MDQRDLAQDIFAFIALVLPAVDDGNGQITRHLEQHHDRHGENAVDLAGDSGQFAPCVITRLELHCKEHIGLKQGRSDGGVFEQRGVARKFLVSELKEKLN